jgi:hypothetical protein
VIGTSEHPLRHCFCKRDQLTLLAKACRAISNADAYLRIQKPPSSCHCISSLMARSISIL